MKPKIAVVGAGISGLIAAYELKKAGCDVVVFEASDYVGGRMATRFKGGLGFDIGANFLVSAYTNTKAYCDELGVPVKRMKLERHFVYKQGRLHRLVIDTIGDLLSYSLISWPSRLRLLVFFMRCKLFPRSVDFFDLRSARRFDTMDAFRFCKKYLGEDVADYLADGMTPTYQFHRSDDLSAATMQALATLMAADLDGFFQEHMIGEMSALPDALAKRVPVKVSSPVDEVVSKGGKVVVRCGKKSAVYDAVVLACTGVAARNMLTKASKGQKEFLDSVKYASTITVGFRIPKDALGGVSSVWVPWVESQTVCSYSNEAIKGQVSGGKTLVNVWLHEGYARTLLSKSDSEIYKCVAQELRRVSPHLKDVDVIPHDIQRWPQAMPKFAHGYITKVADFLDKSQGDGGVYFCGDYLDSPWVEGSVRCGQRVAKRIVDDFKK